MKASIDIDKLFVDALLNSGAAISELTGGRVYDPGRTADAEREDKIPYVVVNVEGGYNVKNNKDIAGEGDCDSVSVNVLLVAESRKQISEMFNSGREAIGHKLVNSGIVDDYSVKFSPLAIDIEKPCVYMTLTYDVEVLL